MKIPWLEPLGLTDSSSYNQHHPSWTWESTLKATAASGKHMQPLTIASHMRISVFPLTCYQLQNQFLESAGLAIIEGLVPKVEALHLVARTFKKAVVVQLLIMSIDFVTPQTAPCQLPCSSPSPRACSNSFIESVMPSNHLILCWLLLLLSSVFPSIRVFYNQLALHMRLPKFWSFTFSISPSNEYSGFIFFRTDWLDLLAVRGAGILRCPIRRQTLLTKMALL